IRLIIRSLREVVVMSFLALVSRHRERRQAQCPSVRVDQALFGHAVCAELARSDRQLRQSGMEDAMARQNSRTQRRPERCDEFILTQVGTRCWLVACNGHLIAGALLSSLRAAREYAAAIAEGSGHRFHLHVVPATH